VLRIRDVYPWIQGKKDSGSWIMIHIKEFRIPDPGVKKAPNLESATLIVGPNAFFNWFSGFGIWIQESQNGAKKESMRKYMFLTDCCF